ncbi:hypothetical protein Dimus_030162 [Dionaea muscipula]
MDLDIHGSAEVGEKEDKCCTRVLDEAYEPIGSVIDRGARRWGNVPGGERSFMMLSDVEAASGDARDQHRAVAGFVFGSMDKIKNLRGRPLGHCFSSQATLRIRATVKERETQPDFMRDLEKARARECRTFTALLPDKPNSESNP